MDNIILEDILFYAGGEGEGREHYNKKERDETESWKSIIMINKNESYWNFFQTLLPY